MTINAVTGRRVLQFIAAHVRQLGCTPTIRQISSGVRAYDRDVIREIVESLQAEGYIVAGEIGIGPVPGLTLAGEREVAA